MTLFKDTTAPALGLQRGGPSAARTSARRQLDVRTSIDVKRRQTSEVGLCGRGRQRRPDPRRDVATSSAAALARHFLHGVFTRVRFNLRVVVPGRENAPHRTREVERPQKVTGVVLPHYAPVREPRREMFRDDFAREVEPRWSRCHLARRDAPRLNDDEDTKTDDLRRD